MLSITWRAWVSPNPDMSPITVFTAPFREGDRHSHELLRKAAQLFAGQDPGSVVRNEWGKPFFSDMPQLHFSISHSGMFWLCAFSECPVGADLQCHGSYVPPETLSRRFFHPLEDAFLQRDGYKRFYDLWTAKESFVKFIGTGFYTEPESFSVVAEDGAFPAVPGATLRHSPFREGYSLCLCSKEIDGIVLREMI